MAIEHQFRYSLGPTFISCKIWKHTIWYVIETVEKHSRTGNVKMLHVLFYNVKLHLITAIQTARSAAVALRRSAARFQRGGTASQRAYNGRTIAARCRLGTAYLPCQRAIVQHSRYRRKGCANLDKPGWHGYRFHTHSSHIELLDEFAKVSVRRANVFGAIRELYVFKVVTITVSILYAH